MTRCLRAALAAVVLVVLGACEVTSNVVVEPDGSGSYTLLVTLPDEDGDPGEALYETLQGRLEASGSPTRVERYREGGQSGAELTYDFVSLEDLEAEAARLEEAGSGLGGIEVHRDDDGWHFDAAGDSARVAPDEAPTGSPGGDIDPSRFDEAITVKVVVELPGQPAESNATAVTRGKESSTFTWALDSGREDTPLQASTTFVGDQADVDLATGRTDISSAADDDGGATATPFVIAGVGLAVLGAAAVVAIRRNRRPPTTD